MRRCHPALIIRRRGHGARPTKDVGAIAKPVAVVPASFVRGRPVRRAGLARILPGSPPGGPVRQRLLFPALLIWALPALVSAQSADDPWSACMGNDSARAITACSSIIEAG